MKKIIIVGSSRGIGFELLKKFAEAGHEVLALSRSIEPIASLNHKNIRSMACNISNEADLDKLQYFLKQNFNQTDILINNAGAIVNKAFAETSFSEFEKVYKTNVFGVAAVTQKVLPFMNQKGHVVNISSMGGVQGSMKFPGLAAYSSSKGALITLTELLAEEYKENGPAFNVLALGAVQTEMLEEAFPGYKAPTSAAEMANYIYDFSLNGNKYYNGKILQVSNSTP